MSRSGGEKKILEKVVLEKTGPHVRVTAGPYTKRQLRELLLSSLSLLGGSRDREAELARLLGVDPDDIRRMKDGEIFGVDGKELLEEQGKKLAAIRLVNLIAKEEKIDVENDLLELLRSKGISDDLINRILKYGLTDEVIRLLKALGLTDEEIAELLGMWNMLVEQRSKSEESCLSVGSWPPVHLEEYMSVDGFYLIGQFRNPLTKALADIVRKKPWNPAEYLGHWLLNYKICEERERKRKELHAELQAERERLLIKVKTEPNVSEADEDQDAEEGIAEDEDWNFMEYEGD